MAVVLLQFNITHTVFTCSHFYLHSVSPLMCLCAGYRHVYLEGMEEASIFVHVAVNDITGKVGTTDVAAENKQISIWVIY